MNRFPDLPDDGAADRSAPVPRLFSEALALPTGERARFLEEECGGDPALRAEIESLLAAHGEAGDFLERSPSPGESLREFVEPADGRIGSEIGPYRILRLIDVGGMGSIYLGERTDEAYRKQVAIKLVRPGLWGDEILGRFRTERQVLADLDHPGIARLIDGGSTESGLPYLVMEYVDGDPITVHCAERDLDLPGRLALFLGVCEAVAYAHKNLVIHRDLKPNNIFVDRGGRVKLLDFGIAKVLGDPGAGGGLYRTAAASRPLTPRYASPEQVAGRRTTTATDVYGLGLVLYELLTGRFPYELDGKTPSEVTSTILDAAPVRPSRRTDPARGKGLAGDLDMIVLKALHKEPERRYSTVEEFGADIRRHLAGLPVHARPDTAAYRLSKFARRNKTLVGSVAAVLLVLVAALVLTQRAYHQAAASKRDAEAHAYVASLAAAEASLVSDKVAEAALHLEAAPEHLRGWEWAHLHARLDRSSASFRAHGKGITRIVYAPGEESFLTASMDSTVRVWRGTGGELERSYGPFSSGVETAAFVPGGDLLAVGLNDGDVLLVERSDGTSRALGPVGAPWALLDANPDGARLASGFFDGTVRVWSLPEGVPVDEWKAHETLAVTAYSPDGKFLATGGYEGLAKIYDARSHRLTHTLDGRTRRIYNLCWSPDASRLVAGSVDRTAVVWEVRTARLLSSFHEHLGTVGALAFDPTGNRVVTSGADNRLLVWDAATARTVSSLRGHRSDVTAIAASRDGATILTGDWGGTVKAWTWSTTDVRTLRVAPALDFVPTLNEAAIDPAESIIACATNLEWIAVWRRGEDFAAFRLPSEPARRLAFTADGAYLAVGCESGRVLLFDSVEFRVRRDVAAHGGPVLAMAVDPGGGRLVTASSRPIVKIWALPALDSVGAIDVLGSTVRDLEFSPGGERLAWGNEEGEIRVIDLASDGPPRILPAGGAAVRDIAFDPSGVRLAAACADGSVAVWDLDRYSVTVFRRPGGATMTAVSWSRDGSRLAGGGTDDIVRIFDPALGREVAALHGHIGRVTSLRFTKGDAALISTSRDGTVRMWEAGAENGRPSSGR